MDTPEMRAGTTCYLGVNVDGALFSLGDGHARQGEGETCGVAVECAMDTELVIDLIKGAAPTVWPRLEDDEFIMTTGSARPLEDAFRIAHSELVGWVRELTGLSSMDAYQLVSQTALTPIANVVDTNYTVVAKMAKRYLGPEHHGDVRQPRSAARSWILARPTSPTASVVGVCPIAAEGVGVRRRSEGTGAAVPPNGNVGARSQGARGPSGQGHGGSDNQDERRGTAQACLRNVYGLSSARARFWTCSMWAR